MMNPRILGPLLLASTLSSLPLRADDSAGTPSVDEILANHIAARGGFEAIAAVETVVYSRGLYREPGFEGSGQAFMALARPYLKVVGNPDSPGGYMEGWDGAAWEWFADPGIAIRTVGEASAASRHGAYVDGTLVDHRAKGATAELGDLVRIGDRPAWQISLTARDGFRVDYFLDAATWLVVAERMAAPVHAYGEPVQRETRVGDYRPVPTGKGPDVLFPYHFAETDIASGEMVSEMRWGSIEVNRELPRAWFSPPDFERDALQAFLEHLYFERTDAEAVMWTYAEFRRVHPEIETRAGVELIGYQMLKMGDTATAVQLLESNAFDHPSAAAAAFGLGRAYAAAGDADRAREAFGRALELDPDHRRAAESLAALD